MEVKEQIRRLRLQISNLRDNLKGAKGDFKEDLQAKITELEAKLAELLAQNPHDDGTGRKQIPGDTATTPKSGYTP